MRRREARAEIQEAAHAFNHIIERRSTRHGTMVGPRDTESRAAKAHDVLGCRKMGGREAGLGEDGRMSRQHPPVTQFIPPPSILHGRDGHVLTDLGSE
jgi:hypothetical protein